MRINRAEALKLALGIAASAFFLWISVAMASPEDFLASMSELSLPLVALALFVSLIEVSIRAIRWRSLLEPHVSAPFLTSFLYICVGHFANTLLPFRLGDAARAYLAGSTLRTNRLTVFGTIVIERLADGSLLLCVLLISAAIGIVAAQESVLLLIPLATAGMGLLAGLVVWRRQIYRAVARVMPRVAGPVRALLRAFGGVSSVRGASTLAVTTVGSFVAASFIMMLVLAAAGARVEWWVAAVAISAMTLSSAVPAAPGGIGTYEFAGVAALAAFGVSPDVALTSVVVVHVIATLPPAVIGLLATTALHVNVLGLRRGHSGTAELPSVMAATDPGC